MSFVAIRAKIKAKLDSLVPATFKEVYDGEQDQQKVDFGAFPVAELRRSGNEGDYLTNREDLQSYAFEIVIYTEASNQDYADAEKEADAILDTLISQFTTDRDLTGTADGGVEPVVTGSERIEWRGKMLHATTLTLRCRKIIAQ